jgi:hypothetical protein
LIKFNSKNKSKLTEFLQRNPTTHPFHHPQIVI